MNFLSSYRHKYYLHQAYSRHSNLAFATDLAKAATFTGLVAMVGWVSYSLAAHQPDSAFNNPSQPTQSAESGKPVANENEPYKQYDTVMVAASASTDTLAGVIAKTAPVKATKLPAVAVTETPSSTDQKIIYTSGWISRLPADKYIIQVASSTDRKLLLEDALAFPYGPIAVYPFSKSKSKQVIYGLSSGIYNSFDDARRAFNVLPPEVIANGPWIREVSTIKKQIQRLSIEN